MPTRISKVHASWRLKQTRISKTFYTHYTRVASFDFGEIQTQKTIFLRAGHLYFYTIQSLRTVYFSVLSNNLSNWCHEQFFFAPTFTKRIQSSADGTSWLVTSSLTWLWAFSRASVLTHQSTCGKSNQFWPWRNSLKLHVFVCWGRRLSSLNFSSTVNCLPNSFWEFWHV